MTVLDTRSRAANHIQVSRLKNMGGSLFVVISLLILYSQLPLGTAFEFSSDENYETMKPFLCNHGYVLYKDIWNDEPPVFTVILAAAFKIFGTSILTARVVSACFGLILITAFHDLIRRRSGQCCALISTFLLLSSPAVLLLSVATMQEVPTMATGLFAAWLLFQWKPSMHWAWLVILGAVMAVAIQIKLTAVLLLPAIVLEFVLLSRERQGGSIWIKDSVRNILLWIVGIAAICMLVGLTWAKGSFEQSWKSHTSEQIVPGIDRIQDHHFTFSLLWNHMECVLAAIVGIGLALTRKRGREIVFPVTLLLTDSLVHGLHQPWFDYYYLHFAVPITWLAGWGITEVIQDIMRLYAKYGFNFNQIAVWKQWAFCILVGLVITRSELRLEWAIKDLRQCPSADANPIIKKMKEYSGHAKLAYSEPGPYAFQAGFAVPPELAEVTFKRFWSGQITDAQIIETCRKDNVELIVLPKSKRRISEAWKSILNSKYEKATEDENSVLFIFKKTETR